MARVKVLSNFPPRPRLRPPAASCCSGDQEHVRGSKLSDYYDENCGALKISKFVKKLFNLNLCPGRCLVSVLGTLLHHPISFSILHMEDNHPVDGHQIHIRFTFGH